MLITSRLWRRVLMPASTNSSRAVHSGHKPSFGQPITQVSSTLAKNNKRKR